MDYLKKLPNEYFETSAKIVEELVCSTKKTRFDIETVYK